MAHDAMVYRKMMAMNEFEQEWLDERMWTKTPLVEIDSFIHDMIEAKYAITMKHGVPRALLEEDDARRGVPFINTLCDARNVLRHATVLPVVCQDDLRVYRESIAMNSIELEWFNDKPWTKRPLTTLDRFMKDMIEAKRCVIMSHTHARIVYEQAQHDTAIACSKWTTSLFDSAKRALRSMYDSPCKALPVEDDLARCTLDDTGSSRMRKAFEVSVG
jgi:hypothetical protein